MRAHRCGGARPCVAVHAHDVAQAEKPRVRRALISSHLFAHHVRFNPQPGDFRRFVYVHTPARYIWAPELDGRGGRTARTIAAALRPLTGSGPADRHLRGQQRLRPPPDGGGMGGRGPGHLSARRSHRDPAGRRLERAAERPRVGHPGRVAGRLPARRLALRALQAAGPGDRGGRGCGPSVVLAGGGPELCRLRAAAGTRQNSGALRRPAVDGAVRAPNQRAAVFVFPAVEDFGIMPVEAMAAGAPVVAQAVGGTAESVVPGLTGAQSTFCSRGRDGRRRSPQLWRPVGPTVAGTRNSFAPNSSPRRDPGLGRGFVTSTPAPSPVVVNQSFVMQRVTGQQALCRRDQPAAIGVRRVQAAVTPQRFLGPLDVAGVGVGPARAALG